MIPAFIYKLKKLLFKSQRAKVKSHNNLPGASVLSSSRKNAHIQIHQYSKPFFSIRYTFLNFINRIVFTVEENEPGIRLEAVLTGELTEQNGETSLNTLRSGEYRLSDNPRFTALFKKNSACSYFLTRYSDELLDQIGIKDIIKPAGARFMSAQMRELIQKVLSHPHEEKLREFYYDNCIRELLFLHLTDTEKQMPGELTDHDLSAIYNADSLLLQNLKVHHTIQWLSEKVGLNEFKLKKGFKAVYQMGIFERLTWHRMEMAKTLLSTTHRTIDDIADEAGYSSRTSFITAFRKKFATTPKHWRQKQKV